MKSIKNQADVLRVFEITGWEQRNKTFDDLKNEQEKIAALPEEMLL